MSFPSIPSTVNTPPTSLKTRQPFTSSQMDNAYQQFDKIDNGRDTVLGDRMVDFLKTPTTADDHIKIFGQGGGFKIAWETNNGLTTTSLSVGSDGSLFNVDQQTIPKGGVIYANTTTFDVPITDEHVKMVQQAMQALSNAAK